MLDDVNTFLAPVKSASVSTNVIETGIDFYRIVRPNQKEDASASNLPRSYSNIYQTKVYVNGSEVAFSEIEDGGKFATYDFSAGNFIVGHTYTIKTPGSTNFIAIGSSNNNVGTTFVATGIGSGSGVATGTYRTDSGKYKILLASFPPLEDAEGNASVIKYVIERYTYPDWYTEGDDPDTVTVETDVPLPGKPERSSGPEAWKNSNGSDTHIKANSIIEWNGTRWTMIFDPDDFDTNIYITNLRTGIQYKWDGVQWLKSFEGEYLPDPIEGNLIIRLQTLPSVTADIVAKLRESVLAAGGTITILPLTGRIGLSWPIVPDNAAELIDSVAKCSALFGASWFIDEAPIELRSAAWCGPPATVSAIHLNAGIRSAFDPDGRLNSGRFAPGS
jgi:hypothetical protein